VEFRAEFFDIINHTNFQSPASGLFVPAPNGAFTDNPTFGQITMTTGNAATGGSQRVIQFALKLIF
jgi:hypothetical protein